MKLQSGVETGLEQELPQAQILCRVVQNALHLRIRRKKEKDEKDEM